MVADSTIRLTELVILLRSANQYVAKEQIRDLVEGYRGLNDMSFERMFSRDKEILRGQGTRVETGRINELFDDEIGYRIRQEDFELPELNFDQDEMVLLLMATQVWKENQQSTRSKQVLQKLLAAGISVDTDLTNPLVDSFLSVEPGVELILSAIRDRRVIQFEYGKPATRRKIQPWSVLGWGDGWYVRGFDLTRNDRRTFKLSRFASMPKLVGGSAAFEIPKDKFVDVFDPDDKTESQALIALSNEKSAWANQIGDSCRKVSSDALAEMLQTGSETFQKVAFQPNQEKTKTLMGHNQKNLISQLKIGCDYEVYQITYHSQFLLERQLSRLGPDAIVLSPQSLRQKLISRMEAVSELPQRQAALSLDRHADPSPRGKTRFKKTSSTSVDQADSLITMVAFLLANQGISKAEFAKKFDLEEAKVENLLLEIMCLGVPSKYQNHTHMIDVDLNKLESSGQIFLTNANYFSRPMKFTVDQVNTLLLGLQAVKPLVGAFISSKVDRVIEKLSALAIRVDESRLKLALNFGQETVQNKILQGIKDGLRVQLTYLGLSSSKVTKPVVDPVKIEVVDGYGYLHAWAVDPQDWRSYRLDQIQEVQVLAEKAANHPSPPSANQWFIDSGLQVHLTLTLDGLWVAEKYGLTPVTYFDDDTIEVDISVTSPTWLTGLLLVLGADVIAVTPPDAGRRAEQIAQETLTRYKPG